MRFHIVTLVRSPLEVPVSDLFPALRQQLRLDPGGAGVPRERHAAEQDHRSLVRVRPLDEVEQEVEQVVAGGGVMVQGRGADDQRNQLVARG